MDISSQIKFSKNLQNKSKSVIKMKLIYGIKIICQNIRLTGAICCDNMGIIANIRNKIADISPLINSL